MKETRPQISMREAARYRTQAGVWDNHVKGPLTDRQIERYIAQGRYGEDARKAQERSPKAVYKAKLVVAKTKRQELNERIKYILA